MPKRNTKEIILYKALELFADKGYDGVSVRDIAGAVGIKQSSLYKHYKNKQAIFDTLVEQMQRRFQDASMALRLPQGELQDIAAEYAEKGNDMLREISSAIFLYYLQDPYAAQFRKMLSVERYKQDKVNGIYSNIYIDTPISYQSLLFSEMIRQGFMKEGDPEIMAAQFFSPIFVLLNKYEAIPEKKDEALAILGRHIEQFDRIYRM